MKKVLIFSALFLLASVSLSAQVVKGAGLWYFNGLPNVTPSVATGTEIAYSINNKSLFKWNRTTSAWVAVVQDSSATNELQNLSTSGDTLYLSLSGANVPLGQYKNHVWEIASLSDTTSITGEFEGDVAYVTGGDTIAFRDVLYWLPFTGGGGGGTFNSFNIAGDTGSSVVTDGQTVTVAGGYGINTAESGGTVTVTADTTHLATQSDISGFGTMSSFTVAAGSGTPQTITNGNTLTMSEGYGINTLASATDDVRTEVDTTQIATQNDISGLPSGTGTNQRIVVWTGTNSQGNSTQLQSAAGVTLDANLAYRITGGTTASRPTGAAGMMYWNTSNVWWDFHNGTAWFNPARSATTNGLFTAGSVLFGGSAGTIQQDNTNFFFNDSDNALLIGGGTPITVTDKLFVSGSSSSRISIFCENTSASGNASFYFRNDRGSFNTYGGLLTGGSADGGSALFGLSRADRTFLFSDGGSSNGFAVGTLTADPTTIGTNNAARITILSTGEVGIGTIAADRLLHSELSDAVTNAMVFPLRLTHITSGTSAAGSGAGMEFESESAGGTNRVAGTIENPYTTATNAAEVSDLVFRTMRAGTLTESLRILGNGTLQIGTLSGTATQLMGATAGNIATAVTLGTGLSFSSGTLNGAFLPLTLTGATEVNTAGQNLYFRDAAGYPFTFMNSNYFLAASSVNNYIDVGSTANRLHFVSDGLIELNSSVNTSLITTQRLLVDADSIVIQATLPVNTNATNVLVRDVSTQRLEEKAISTIGSGVYLPLSLSGTTEVVTNGNQLTLRDSDSNPYLALTSGTLEIGTAASTTFNMTGSDIDISAGGTGGDVYMYGLAGVVLESDAAASLTAATTVDVVGQTVNLGVAGTTSVMNIAVDNDILMSSAGGDISVTADIDLSLTGVNIITMQSVGNVDVDAAALVVNSAAHVENLIGLSAAPSLSIANAGTGATVTGYSAENSNVSGRFTFTTGTGVLTGGNVVTVTFTSLTFPQVPVVQIAPDGTKNTAAGLAAAVLIGVGKAVPIASTTDFVLYIDATGLLLSTRYDFTYTVSSAN